VNAGMLLLTALVCAAWWFWSKREPEVRAVLRRMARYSLWSPKRLATVFLAVVIGGLLLRSTFASGGSKPAPSPVAVASPSPTVATALPVSPPPSPSFTPTPTSGSPKDTASRFVAIWANRTDPYWLTNIKMLVTTRLAKVFSFTDPHNIPATKVTGPGRLLGSADGAAFAEVPTDAGAMAVTLVTDPADPKGWLVDGIEKTAR
jgi:hypothetical protein